MSFEGDFPVCKKCSDSLSSSPQGKTCDISCSGKIEENNQLMGLCTSTEQFQEDTPSYDSNVVFWSVLGTVLVIMSCGFAAFMMFRKPEPRKMRMPEGLKTSEIIS